jgi:hypothetical protein
MTLPRTRGRPTAKKEMQAPLNNNRANPDIAGSFFLEKHMDVITAVRAKLDEAASVYKIQPKKTRCLTLTIHKKVACAARALADDLGIKYGELAPGQPRLQTLVVYCTGAVVKHGGAEFLFDHCWLTQFDNENETNGYLFKCNLAMEVEMAHDFEEVHYDFQKLIIAKADVKVMVCKSKTCVDAEKLIAQLNLQIRLADSSVRASYLLSCYCCEDGVFHHDPPQ